MADYGLPRMAVLEGKPAKMRLIGGPRSQWKWIMLNRWATAPFQKYLVTNNAFHMTKLRIETLKEDLREELYLNLDKYLTEESPGRFSAVFLGIRLDSVFQPVMESQTDQVIGFEALLRPTVGGLATITPQMAFQYAESYGKLVKFDRICRILHLLNSFSLSSESGLLFVNVHPRLLSSVDSHGRVFEQILYLYSVPTHSVVIEIQASELDNEVTLRKAVDNYRDCGYQVAIDDFGRRGSGPGWLWRESPDFVKFDVSFVRKADQNEKLRRMFPKLIEVVHETGADVVVGGIASEPLRHLAITAGARHLQGYQIGKPAPASHWSEDSCGEPVLEAAVRTNGNERASDPLST
jgi:EAL domain-containing protein (putative c-di-GMP-specific phosphodiesterase class I)